MTTGGEPEPEPVEIVAADRAAAYVVRVGGRDQSHVDLSDPTLLAFDYVRRMGDVVDAAAPAGEPVAVLHVGGAGLTLPRYVAATRPGSPQVVLEPDADLTALVRERLPLPRRSGIKVRPVDGVTGVRAVRDGWAGLVLLDAYAGGEVPAGLLVRSQVAEVDRVLAPGGLYLLNLADRAPFAATRRAVATLRERFAHVMVSAEPATLRGRRPGNLLVVVGHHPVPVAALSRRAASSAAPYRVLDAAAVSDGLGGGLPLDG